MQHEGTRQPCGIIFKIISTLSEKSFWYNIQINENWQSPLARKFLIAMTNRAEKRTGFYQMESITLLNGTNHNVIHLLRLLLQSLCFIGSDGNKLPVNFNHLSSARLWRYCFNDVKEMWETLPTDIYLLTLIHAKLSNFCGMRSSVYLVFRYKTVVIYIFSCFGSYSLITWCTYNITIS